MQNLLNRKFFKKEIQTNFLIFYIFYFFSSEIFRRSIADSIHSDSYGENTYEEVSWQRFKFIFFLFYRLKYTWLQSFSIMMSFSISILSIQNRTIIEYK